MITTIDKEHPKTGSMRGSCSPAPVGNISVAVLTGGSDKPYVFGLTNSLLSQGAVLDLIGSDELDVAEFRNKAGLAFFNLRGDQGPGASLPRKVFRVLLYYARLVRYAATARPGIFHILWNNKFEMLDRTLLMLIYKLAGRKTVLTVHNVNAGKRDGRDTRLNRLTLRMQYRLADHLFVHTEKMKRELTEEFGASAARITVIPFGINNAVPNTDLTPADAKRRLGLDENDKIILFFGRITPYKGLEYLLNAFRVMAQTHNDYRLLIAGRPDRCDKYWTTIREGLSKEEQLGKVLLRADFIPDGEVEVYFKAADVLVLPYRDIYQSGVLFLAHSFGLPVVAADVGSLREEIVEGETGFLFRAEDATQLANALEQYFDSDLCANLNTRRRAIRQFASERHSWDVVARATMQVYSRLLRTPSAVEAVQPDERSASVNAKASS